MERDSCKSKMTPNYLREMENKIFHMKVEQNNTDACRRETKNIEKYLHNKSKNTELIHTNCSETKRHNPTARSSNVKIAFPRDLIDQLSQHERFKAQNERASNEYIKITNPLINTKASRVQLDHEKDMEIIDLMKKPSGRRLESNSAKKALPPKTPTRRRTDLFNPNFAIEVDRATNHHGTSIGRNLLESIRNKVFGFKLEKKATTVSVHDDCDWNESKPNISETVFPRETKHAMSALALRRPTNVCVSCSKQIRNVQMMDAQTSPVSSLTRIHRSFGIPCPMNLLCDRGIHVGRCDDKVRDKISESSARKSRRNVLFKERQQNYPGKATLTRELPPEANVISYQLSSNDSDVSVGVEAKISDETFLKLMELQEQPDQPDYPIPPPPMKKVTKSANYYKNNMNGMNGHTNGDLNGCGDIITQNQQKGCWTIGLINSKFRYLTAETFGFKINANGASLKKKQIWTLEPENANSGDSLIYLRSHLDKYLAVDSFGNVTCESEEKDPGCVFHISVSEDGSGRWALRNVVRGYFLGSTSDKLTCTAKVPGDAEFWHIHLAARPQVNLRSVGRKRFAHLSENLDEIHVDANIPWGEDTLFTLEFRLDESGKYAIHTCNNKYLSMGGKLVDTCNKDCLFSAEYHSGQLALRDRTGAYLSPIGSKAVLKTRSNTVTKDELFSLEDSLPQASFVASLNSRFVSVKQGVDVTANQDEISDHETFQLEFDWSTKRWYIRTMQDRYWTLETGGGIQASGDKRSSNALFDLVWQEDGSLAFRANNGRYVITKRSGHLYATSDAIDDNCKYFFYLINRPILVLKCEQGFVGYKAASSPKLECNKATYECIQVERGEKGVVYFKGQNGKYWHVDSEGVTADSDTQEGFYLELREPTRLCIKSMNGNYLTANKNGLFRLGDTSIENATQWEY